ncbi:MAG: RNA 2',3'-cyclic phosphodiesterase [Candidatus Woesearchaeota archaeon]
MRLFIAITLPDDAKTQLANVQKKLGVLGAKITYTHDYHLTLKFLGEVSNSSAIVSALNNLNLKKFRFSLSSIDFFPNERCPRVVWVGVTPKKPIIELQQQIESLLTLAGFEKDTRFHPHITLGRIKQSNKEFCEQAKNMPVQPISIEVDKIYLIRSELGMDGPKYTVIERFA